MTQVPRIWLAIGGVVAVFAVALLVFALVQPPAQLVVASPSPTPTPTVVPSTPAPTPTPSPTPSPTPTAPPTQQPTAQPTISYDAGTRMLPYYFQIRQLFTSFPPTPKIDPDENSDVPENAVSRGLDPQGQPIFAVRHDFVIDMPTTAHEMGHAYQALMTKKDPTRDVLAAYWAFRGFPGTWQQADATSRAQTSYSAQWIMSPVESFAEAFRAAVTLEVKERTLDYGKTIDPAAARQFFLSLAK